jgi:hypothetical protein
MGYENVGRVWTPAELRTYLGTLDKPAWATSITFHHTGVPSLEQRPRGFLPTHMTNLQHYYQVTNGWSAGPHLFIDEDQCWGMSDFRQQGVHAKSFNSNSIGIEVLGNYDVESPNTGRGQQCWTVAAGAGKVLLDWLGLQPSTLTVNFHRDDPKTTKTCPGSLVDKNWVIEQINAAAAREAMAAIGAAVGAAAASVVGLLGFRF